MAEEQSRYPENRNSEGYADPTYWGGTRWERQKSQKQALALAERAKRLKDENAALKRRLQRVEGKRDRYRQRCRAWEDALAALDGLYWDYLRKAKGKDVQLDRETLAKAYGLALALSSLRRDVAEAYEGCAHLIEPRRLNVCKPSDADNGFDNGSRVPD